jgi:hypothetical protein
MGLRSLFAELFWFSPVIIGVIAGLIGAACYWQFQPKIDNTAPNQNPL